MSDTFHYKDHKEKIRSRGDYNKYVTTSKELKGFTKQVESENFGDKHFEKAYSKFKAPVDYGKKGN